MKLEEELYTQYFRSVYAFAFTLTHDANEAEELTQETFFKAIRSIKSFRNESTIDTYLCAIAHNLYISGIRKKKRWRSEKALEKIPAEGNMEEALIQKETLDSIYRQLDNLDEPYKKVFVLRILRELSFSEIGAICGKSDNWARVTYFRAKQRLQTMVKEE